MIIICYNYYIVRKKITAVCKTKPRDRPKPGVEMAVICTIFTLKRKAQTTPACHHISSMESVKRQKVVCCLFCIKLTKNHIKTAGKANTPKALN